MKATIILVLALTISAFGQQRNSALDVALPTLAAAGTVTLSLSEYNNLVQLAARKTKAPEAALPPFVLSSAIFRLRVENHSLLGMAYLEGDLLGKGPVKVPLTTGLTVLEAKQWEVPIPLMLEGATHATVLSLPGRFGAQLKVASSLAIEAGRASFTLAVPPASSSVLSLDLPGSHADVRIEPGLITSRMTSNGHTLIEATLEPGKPARVWWTTREASAPVAQREVRFLSDIKTVVSVGDSQLRLTALCDLTIIQGESAEFRLPLPAGFELTEATGTTLDSAETDSGVLILRVRESAGRNHQFLIAMERPNRHNKVDAPLLAFAGAQRETGEVLVEGVGAMELIPKESGGLRRMDVREAGAIAKSLARFPLQAAFRYNRRQGDTPKLQLEWTQFPDSQVLSAVVERATVTTLMNVEGKSLTEVILRVRNHAQAFVKVDLPAGAQLFSAEVGGEPVKPVAGPDGSRVPLLRAGFNPLGAYTVSFVYLNSGTRFTRGGAYDMGLPKLDIPINLLTWEISLPDRLEVKQFGGNALAADLFPAAAQNVVAGGGGDLADDESMVLAQGDIDIGSLAPGQIGGIIVDANGAVLPGANVTVVNKQTGSSLSTTSDAEGRWVVSGAQPGPTRVAVESTGFTTVQHELELARSRPARLGTTLSPGNVAATVNVTSEMSSLLSLRPGTIDQQSRKSQQAQLNAPSQNVFNLQRRVVGILPVRVDVPRAGKSYRFARALVLDEETKVTFQYKSKS